MDKKEEGKMADRWKGEGHIENRGKREEGHLWRREPVLLQTHHQEETSHPA